MAIGDDALAAGYALVPSSGEEGKIKYGVREINRTRDYIAQLKNTAPKSKSEVRISGGITAGTANPSGGEDGDIYFKILG